MLLTIHDANLNQVASIDNDKSDTLNYFDDTWTRDLETGSSTFEFSVYKKSLKSDTAYKKAYNYLNEKAFVSFVYKGQTYLFNVMTVEEDETTIQCYCENLNLELISEYANPYKAEKAMSFVEYCNAMDLFNMAKLTVGSNEISDYRRTLEWEGQDTKLARLLSLANKFDAEIDFETILNDDSSLKSFKVNIYHENDDTHQGVGRVRSDIRLTYGKNLKSITRKVDKTGIFNMIVPTSSKTVDNDTDSGESSSKTVTTTNADGSITKTTTKKASDGTTVQTKVTTKVVENADGSKVTTVRTEKSDGSITEKVTTKSANGNTDTVTKTIREATKENAETVDEYITIAGLPDWEIKNDDGIVEFYKKGEALYAPISARLYPSTFTTETQSDQWIRHDMSFDVDSDTKLETEALKQLKANAYPALTYTIKGYIDADIGDTLSMSDTGFVPTLLLTARVSNQKLSFTQPNKNETTLANFKTLESGLTDDIQSRLEELIESSKPYTIRIASTNGTTFKNNTGESTITATLLKGDKTVSADVSWRWALDGNVTVGMQYLARASTIKNTAVLTVSAYVGNNEVATTEITLTNVNDGADGAKGDKGETGNGIANTVITYGLSTSETTEPATWASNM
ncbi:MAG: phage tail protein, partial [Streptococcus gallolyticus]|nr:phage tail protein [Streptococcus gallolyticus]